MKAQLPYPEFHLTVTCGYMVIDDESEIKRWFDRYLTSVAEGDVDTYLASWSDDVIFLPPNQSALMGKDSIRGVAEGIKRSFIEPSIVE